MGQYLARCDLEAADFSAGDTVHRSFVDMQRDDRLCEINRGLSATRFALKSHLSPRSKSVVGDADTDTPQSGKDPSYGSYEFFCHCTLHGEEAETNDAFDLLYLCYTFDEITSI